MINRLKLCQLADSELSGLEARAILAELDDSDKEQLDLYFHIGDIIRSGDLVDAHSFERLAAIEQAIAQEPTVLAPSALPDSSEAAAQPKSAVRSIGWLSGLAATFLFSLGLYQAMPPIDADLAQTAVASAGVVAPQDVALWHDYFLAHQKQGLRGGLSAVSPMARSELRPAQLAISGGDSRPVSSMGWMNVWDGYSETEQTQGRYTVVSQVR